MDMFQAVSYANRYFAEISPLSATLANIAM
jgi:hypothetical protein